MTNGAHHVPSPMLQTVFAFRSSMVLLAVRAAGRVHVAERKMTGRTLGAAFDDSGADLREWCGEAGFRRFEGIHLAGPSSAAIAHD